MVLFLEEHSRRIPKLTLKPVSRNQMPSTLFVAHAKEQLCSPESQASVLARSKIYIESKALMWMTQPLP